MYCRVLTARNDEGVPLEQRNSQTEKDTIYSRRFSLTDY